MIGLVLGAVQVCFVCPSPKFKHSIGATQKALCGINPVLIYAQRIFANLTFDATKVCFVIRLLFTPHSAIGVDDVAARRVELHLDAARRLHRRSRRSEAAADGRPHADVYRLGRARCLGTICRRRTVVSFLFVNSFVLLTSKKQHAISSWISFSALVTFVFGFAIG